MWVILSAFLSFLIPGEGVGGASTGNVASHHKSAGPCRVKTLKVPQVRVTAAEAMQISLAVTQGTPTVERQILKMQEQSQIIH